MKQVVEDRRVGVMEERRTEGGVAEFVSKSGLECASSGPSSMHSHALYQKVSSPQQEDQDAR
jgi:hypothetical protein